MGTVYLAGPITGLSYGNATDWREETIAALALRGITALSPMRFKNYLAMEGEIADSYAGYTLSTAEGITARDRFDVQRCDVVLMNLIGAEKVSIGTMIEAGWADAFRKPVVLVMEAGAGVPMTTEQAAWLAALIDGEGCIHVSRVLRANRSGLLAAPHYQLRLAVIMKTKAMVERAQQITGYGTLRVEKRRGFFCWRAVSQQAAEILRAIYPYLVLKYPQAALAIELQAIRQGGRGRNAPVQGQQGFTPKSPERVSLEADLYARWQQAQHGEEVEFNPPTLIRNPHEHGILGTIAAFRVSTLHDGIGVVHSLLEHN